MSATSNATTSTYMWTLSISIYNDAPLSLPSFHVSHLECPLFIFMQLYPCIRYCAFQPTMLNHWGQLPSIQWRLNVFFLFMQLYPSIFEYQTFQPILISIIEVIFLPGQQGWMSCIPIPHLHHYSSPTSLVSIHTTISMHIWILRFTCTMIAR